MFADSEAKITDHMIYALKDDWGYEKQKDALITQAFVNEDESIEYDCACRVSSIGPVFMARYSISLFCGSCEIFDAITHHMKERKEQVLLLITNLEKHIQEALSK